MLTISDTKRVRYSISVKDYDGRFSKKTFSFSLNIPEAVRGVTLESLWKHAKYSIRGHILDKDVDDGTRYTLTLIPKTYKDKKAVSMMFRAKVLPSRIVHDLKVYFSDIVYRKSTHLVTVHNILTRERDMKSFSLITDMSLEEIRGLFKRYAENEMVQHLDDDIIFPGEQSCVSHRVCIKRTDQLGYHDDSETKTKWLSIRFPHYRSEDIAEELKNIENYEEMERYGEREDR